MRIILLFEYSFHLISHLLQLIKKLKIIKCFHLHQIIFHNETHNTYFQEETITVRNNVQYLSRNLKKYNNEFMVNQSTTFN